MPTPKFMKRIIIIILLAVFTTLTAISPQIAQAFGTTSGASAIFAGSQAVTSHPVEHDNRAEILHAYLQKYNSPLADHAEALVREADVNRLDWKLVAAIAGNESYFGQQIPPYSYNGWGYGVYGNNVRRFSSWDEGIVVVSKALREDYYNKWGATNIAEIGAIYAADSQWANKVTHFFTEIDQYAKPFDKPALSISL